MSRSLSLRGGAAVAVLAAVGTTLAAAGPASAAPWNCEASALRASLSSAPAVEPVTANRGQASCAPARAGGASALGGLPAPVTGSIVGAATDLQPPQAAVETQRATATAQVATLRVGALPGQLPAPPIPAGLGAFQIPGGPAVDLRPAIQALLTPPTELLSVQAADTEVTGQCTNGTPALAARSSAADLRLFGRPLPTNVVTEQALNVVDTQRISPSSLDLSKVVLPDGSSLPAALVTPLQAALAALPPIEIPAQVAQVKVVPGEEVNEGGRLTRRALHVTAAIGGQPLLDLVLGEASVSSAGVACATPLAATLAVAQQSLRCTTKRLVLIDVLERAGRVHLLGVADRKLIGRTVDIRFVTLRPGDRGKRVARVRVGSDGFFRTTAPLPPRSIRASNRARYQAVLGRERSLRLKLVRRMSLTGVRSGSGKVTITGRVTRPLAAPARTIVVKQRVSCTRTVVVKRVTPRRDGTFRVTLAGPPRALAATYRFETMVRKNTRNPKLFPTFTLPRSVEFR
ncbi:MAG: hypothetical protein QOD81_3882 [Solirubrobacteraceae bacterium]|nr:hypothetical protein [Solirubrobacteraceae bacterium]